MDASNWNEAKDLKAVALITLSHEELHVYMYKRLIGIHMSIGL